jgi:hypothetical protein
LLAASSMPKWSIKPPRIRPKVTHSRLGGDL